jgi:hypothetical protein
MGLPAARARDTEALVDARWRRAVIVYCAWTIACAAIVLARDGLSPDNVTHLGIGAYLAITFMVRKRLAPLAQRAPAARDAVRNLAMDLALTVPAYVVIFAALGRYFGAMRIAPPNSCC